MKNSLVFNQHQIDYLQQPLFFGKEGLNMQRYDVLKYPKMDKLTDKMHSFFWRPTEISLIKDRNDYQMQFNHEHRVFFNKNLKRQILLDSANGRGPSVAFLPFVTLPELEAAIQAWTFFETIHSRSYQHIIRDMYNDSSEIFDTVLEDQYIVDCAKDVTKHYDAFIDYGYTYLTTGKGDSYTLKKLLYLALVNVYMLESVRFFVSFACHFAFAQNGLIEGIAAIMTLIARDEKMHVALVRMIIKCLKHYENDLEWIRIIDECKEEAREIAKACGDQEQEWADYLFENDTTLLGVNAHMLKQNVRQTVNKSCLSIDLGAIYAIEPDPIDYLEKWTSSEGVQKAPQETDVTSYRVGSVKMDVSGDFLNKLSLG